MKQIQTFGQLEKAKGYTRQEVKDEVLAGKLYCRKIANRQFYAPTESAFQAMWEKALDFCDAELNARVIEPAPRLASFITYYAKQKKKWKLDPNLSKILVQSLTTERSAGCFLAISDQGYGYLCVFAEKWKSLIAEALQFAAHRMELSGHITLKDFAKISRAHRASVSEWPAFVLKHLAYLGWGDLLNGEGLHNPVFKDK